MCMYSSKTAHQHESHVTVPSQEMQFSFPDLWLPNSVDLNPTDYKIWVLMQERAYKTPVGDTIQLKQRLIDTWSNMSSTMLLVNGKCNCERAQMPRDITLNTCYTKPVFLEIPPYATIHSSTCRSFNCC